MKWGVRSMIWYLFILVIAFCVSLFYYNQFINSTYVYNAFFE